MIDVVGSYVMFVGISDVKDATVWRKRKPVRAPRRFGNQAKLTFRRNVIYAKEIQLPRVRLGAESRISEIDVAVMAHHDVVRRIETLAFPLFGKYLNFSFLVGTHYAARPAFARVQTPLCIERIAVSTVGFLAKNGRLFARLVFQDAIIRNIAEQQKTFARPNGPFCETERSRHPLDVRPGVVLRRHCWEAQAHGRGAKLPPRDPH